MPRCKECGDKFKARFFMQRWCMEKGTCISAFIEFTKQEKQKQFQKQCKQDRRSYYAKNKTYTQKVNEVKELAQEYARLRDQDKPCISCGTNHSDIWDGGHYFKAEIYRGLIFDERNINKQCRRCNRFLGGNEINYRIGLVNRYGEEFVKQLESEANSKREYKWSDEELERMKAYYKQRIKELKQ
ncbi:TPA: recombination protein NinG [Elizabethkingia anophelis]